MKNYYRSYGEVRKESKRERDAELVDLYRKTYKMMLRCGVEEPRDRAIEFALHNGTPRYNVSFERARKGCAG